LDDFETIAQHAALLQPYRIPMRIIINAFDQAGTQRVGYDVAPNTVNIFIVAQGVIMKSALPNRPVETN
jgi:hypothetical protein